REAMHVIELRTTPQGHPAYRAVCQEMWRLIRDRAGHHHLAEAMRFVDLEDHELGRLAGERQAESRRQG
ncbi:MAG: FAD-dependent thymidylate synthase, partial [Acidimicrobiia bacterium]